MLFGPAHAPVRTASRIAPRMRWGVIPTPRIDADSLRLAELGDVALAWRDHVADARARLRESLWPCAQAAAAAGTAWLIAHDVLGHAQPFFAPIAAAIALSATSVRRGRRILQMVAGVMIGIGVGEAATWVMGTSALSIAITVLVTMVAAMAVAVGFFGEGMMFVNQSAAAAVLVVALHRHGTGSERALDALVGGAVAAVIGVGLFPADPLRLLRRAAGGCVARSRARRSAPGASTCSPTPRCRCCVSAPTRWRTARRSPRRYAGASASSRR